VTGIHGAFTTIILGKSQLHGRDSLYKLGNSKKCPPKSSFRSSEHSAIAKESTKLLKKKEKTKSKMVFYIFNQDNFL